MSTNQEQLRLAQETMLQRQQQFRQWAGSRLFPAVDGVKWTDPRPEGDVQTPVLSILSLPLKPSVDLDSGACKELLDAVLQYIGSLPGCSALEWGPSLNIEQARELTCLIHWNSTEAWHAFQHSLGFSPILAMLGAAPSNRCARLAALDMPKLGGTQASPTVVNIVSVDYNTTLLPEHRSALEETWDSLLSSTNRDGLLRSYSVWLEHNAPGVYNPTPAEKEAATKLTTFTAFLAWDQEHYKVQNIEDICEQLQASLLSSRGIKPPIFKKSVRLTTLNHLDQPSSFSASAAPRNTLESILKAGFNRKSSAGLITLQKRARDAVEQSVSDTRANLKQFPSPNGSFIPQGELYDSNKPTPYSGQSYLGSPNESHLVDLVRLRLKDGKGRSIHTQIYTQIKNEVSSLKGYMESAWACNIGDDKILNILTVWEDESSRNSSRFEYRRILDDFANSSIHLVGPLAHEAFPMSQTAHTKKFEHIPCLELISFRVTSGELERQLFEHAYGEFQRMTQASQRGGDPWACMPMQAGGWQPVGQTEQSDYQVFTGVLLWQDVKTRSEWYVELGALSDTSYELFGHALDTLSILASGGVQSQIMAFD